MTELSPQSLDMVRRLIAFDTVSRHSNLALIHWVRDYLADMGVESQLVFDETGQKANLYATIGPKDRSGILLSGHTDVVPVDGQAWDTDPFSVVEKDGRLYGRGTSDMKSFIALCLALAPEMTKANLQTPVHFAFSYDEEVGCIGAGKLAQVIAKMPVRPKACIVGEPTEMQVVSAHKGKQNFVAHVYGFECHSSLTHMGVNAVEYAARLIVFLRGLADEYRTRGPQDPDFEPPYTTVHTGVIQGGTALNIVPKDCSFEFEIRNIPDDSQEDFIARVNAFARDTLVPEMKAVHAGADIVIEAKHGIPALNTPKDAEITKLVQNLTGSNSLHKVSFGTEASLFADVAGVPTIVCGPGSIEQAHKPNEFISLEQLRLGEIFLRKLLARLV